MEAGQVGVSVLLAALGFLALWYRENAKLKGRIAGLIATAEKEFQSWTHAGEKKFEWVVDQLFALIPAPLRAFVPRSLISKMVQGTFEALERYAKIQLNNYAKKTEQIGGSVHE